MSTTASYRKIAAGLRARARKAPSDRAAAELGNLARCYLRLAEQAETNSRLDVAAEFGSPARPDEGEDA
jgi:hypothetical protein